VRALLAKWRAALRRRQKYLPTEVGQASVGGHVVSGSFWSGLSIASTTVLQLVRSVVFARLLEPADFGVVALANVFTQFILIFANFGFNSSVIYHRDLNKQDLSTCWWGNLAVDSAAALACVIFALTTRRFAETPTVSYVICLLAVQFLITSLGSVSAALMRKQFMFKQTAVVNVSGALVIFFGALIGVAVLDWGVYGLVAGMILGNLAMTALNFLYLPWLPSFSFSRRLLRKHLVYGRWFLGVNVLAYVNGNLDKAYIGAFLNNTQLGFFEYAGNIPLMVVNRLTQTLNSVLFPAFSSLQEDVRKLGDLLEKVFRYNALIIMPLLCGIGLVAPDFVLVAYGTKWLPIVDPLRAFCVYGMLRIFINPLYALCNGVGKPALPFKWGLIYLPINALAIYLGATYGGVAGVVVARWLMPLFLMATLGREIMKIIGVSYRRLALATIPALTSCLAMAAMVISLQVWAAGDPASPVLRLVVQILGGIAVYALALAVLWRRHFVEIMGLVKRIRN